jgi:hypothetical protein
MWMRKRGVSGDAGAALVLGNRESQPAGSAFLPSSVPFSVPFSNSSDNASTVTLVVLVGHGKYASRTPTVRYVTGFWCMHCTWHSLWHIVASTGITVPLAELRWRCHSVISLVRSGGSVRVVCVWMQRQTWG